MIELYANIPVSGLPGQQHIPRQISAIPVTRARKHAPTGFSSDHLSDYLNAKVELLT